MGGNAFPNLSLVRVKRDDVPLTVKFLVETLKLDNFTYDYAINHLMGSAMKQADSGDLDFALNNRVAAFVGQNDLPLFRLREFAARCREVLSEGHVNTKAMKSGQFQSAWPVAGDPSKGFVQVDFIEGDPEWLQFSHYSPGKDRSPWKGVMISTMLGVLAKLQKDFEARDEPDAPNCVGARYARVGLHFDLELGLHRKWELRMRVGQGMSKVDPDFFETRMPQAPRFERLGYVTEPTAVLTVLFGRHTTTDQVDTFEKMLTRLRVCMPDKFGVVYERFMEAFTRSAGQNDYSVEEVGLDPMWLE